MHPPVPHSEPTRVLGSPKKGSPLAGGSEEQRGVLAHVSPPIRPLSPQVEFPLDTICTEPTKGWFQLLPFPGGTRDCG